MWTTAQEWVLHDPRFEADDIDPERASGPWAGHRRFAYDLLRHRSPDVIVELGTHYGVSMFAFAQAVKDGGLRTRLHAVDTWEGDPHAGHYGPDVLETFDRVRVQAYPEVGLTRHQMLFEEALAEFPDGSVDLIHIDGYHSYDAARTDFETWLPKLAPDGVVLFHDIAPDTGYGSADYWAEVSHLHPSVAFVHSFGLGVLLPRGTTGWDFLLGREFSRWQAYYPMSWAADLHRLQVRDQARMIRDRDAAIERQARMIEDRDSAIAAQTTMIDERDTLIKQQDELVGQLEAAVHNQPPQHLLHMSATPSARFGGSRLAAIARAGRALVRVVARRHLPRIATPVRLGRGVDADVRTIFDADYYRERYPDVARSGTDPLWHFLQYGGSEGRDPSPFFSSSYYLARYPDVAKAGANPLVHYVRHGAKEGRAPSSAFDTVFYRATYPDVDESINPLVHYLTVGIREGRFVSPDHRRRVMHHALAPAQPGRASERRTVDRVAYSEAGGRVQELPLSMLTGVDVDLVTVDLWDTLVGRTRPADSAKLATARRQFLRHSAPVDHITSPWDLYRARVEVEAKIAASREHQEYHLEEVLAEVLRRCFPDMPEGDRAAEATREARAEWDDEIATTYPIQEVWAFLHELQRRGDAPRIAVLSDFYAGAEMLTELLRSHGWGDLPVLASCEQEASKRLDGALYKTARQSMGVAPDRHLHIGDNRHSDFDMQLASGGRAALLMLSPTSLPVAGELSPRRVEACFNVLRDRLRGLAEFHVEFAPGDDSRRRAVAAGVVSAPLAVAVVARAIEAARERGLDRVHYLSREGAFLASVHDAVAEQLSRGIGDSPQPVHLEVSRRATFGASLDEADITGLARMWTMYGSQSMRALLVSIGADADEFAGAARRHGLDLDSVITNIADDERVQAFLADRAVTGRLASTLREARELLVAYLRQQTNVDARQWVVVDVGWRGSIQDNLAHVLPKTQLHGVYLGLFPFLNPQPGNCTKEAVGFDGNRGEEYAFAEPPAAVERPWTPHVPSTIGYTRAMDGRVLVEHAQETRASELIDDFQAGVLAGAHVVADFLATFGFTVRMVRNEVMRELRDYYERPHGGIADIWFGSEHDDTFGALNVTPFGKDTPERRWLGKEGEARYAAAAMRSRWEPGFSEWLPVLALRELRRMIEENA